MIRIRWTVPAAADLESIKSYLQQHYPHFAPDRTATNGIIVSPCMSSRYINPTVEARVLMRSARRCCLCLYLKRDFSEKEGQIAHLDHDKTNGSEENLAFLCLAHHSLYDSKTSQHKNYTFAETKAAREKLVQRVERFSDEDGEEEREEDTEEESEEPLDDRDEIARLRARGERVYTFEMLDGQQLVGAVSANGFINLLICTKRQYEQWIDSDDDEIVPYVYYEFAEDIRRRSFDFVAPRNGSFVLVLINRSNKDVEMTIDWAWWDTDEED